MYLAFFTVAVVYATNAPSIFAGAHLLAWGFAGFVLMVGVLYNRRITRFINKAREQERAPLENIQPEITGPLWVSPDLVAQALSAQRQLLSSMSPGAPVPDDNRLMEVALQTAFNRASQTQLAPVLQDAGRYAAVRAWFLREGPRSEIHPAGHMQATTPALFDAGVDALPRPKGLIIRSG